MGQNGNNNLRVDGYLRWISVNDVMYNEDIIIHTDGSVTERDESASIPYKDDYFHVPLSERELQFVVEENPEKVIIGSGWRGMLPLTPVAKELLKPYNYVELMTPVAMEQVMKERSRFVAIMHIRC